ncbi:hypothetical protein GSF04_12830 [Pseudoalteromonas sp. A22]|uniref:cyanobactin maturation protease PatG family protein n=1 Tax=Pseudoalteromonas sp. A22 TaxID=327511 RepID=UPI001BA5B73B|nr:hypothetical protein [Pseudoalteromonas sp. A22]QUI63333.1 hypothetical protein GSF04_12830 [Pseudoalteromonas sp. A22]
MSELHPEVTSADPAICSSENAETQDSKTCDSDTLGIAPVEANDARLPSAPQDLDSSEQMQAQEIQHPTSVQCAAFDYIYAVGQVDIVFPNEGIEKQFLQAAMELAVDERAYYEVFTNKSLPVGDPNRDKYLYLAEQVSWILVIQKQLSYHLTPATKVELEALIEALQPPKDTLELVYTCVIGHSSNNHDTNLAEIVCHQVYHQTLSELHNTIQKISSAETNAIQDVIKALEVEPNAGRDDFDRAKNFVAFRYPDIYLQTHKMRLGSATLPSASLTDITFSQFDAVSEHKIVDITLTYKENASAKHHYYFCRIDVSGLYPFINTEIQQFLPLLNTMPQG